MSTYSDARVNRIEADNESADLSWQSQSLNTSDTRVLSASLLGLSIAIERLVHELRSTNPPSNSVAASYVAWPRNPENAEGSTHIASAQESLLTSCLAATDHVRGFVRGVRSGQTVSNWTLARGAIEAVAPVHFMLTSSGPEQFLGRHIGLILAETRFDTEEEYAYRYGPMLSVREYRDALKALASELDVSLPTSRETSTTQLVSSLIDFVAPGSDGRRRYSSLSAVAHGHAPGIHMFIPDLDGPMVLPSTLVFEAVHLQAACVTSIGDALVKFFSPVVAVAARWSQARARAVGGLLGDRSA